MSHQEVFLFGFGLTTRLSIAFLCSPIMGRRKTNWLATARRLLTNPLRGRETRTLDVQPRADETPGWEKRGRGSSDQLLPLHFYTDEDGKLREWANRFLVKFLHIKI